jgi:nucleoside-diphosphate-sugar epimerase
VRVLVTGANGFLGATLSRRLIDRGDEVRGLVRKTSDLSLLDGVRLKTVIGSLEDIVSLEKAVDGMDLVYHIAAAVTDWGSYKFFRRVNVEGTRNLLEASISKRVKRFVFVSSVAVHTFIGSQEMNEESPQLPTPFPYCQTKREAEALVMEAHNLKKIPVTIVRPGDIFGPGDRVSLLKMAKLLEAGKMAYIGGGKTLGAFTYVENLADGLILAGRRKEAVGQAYVMTDGIKLTWKEYFVKLTDALDLPNPKFSVNPALAYAAASVMEFFYRILQVKSRPPVTRYLITHLRKDFHFSIEKATREIGYNPQIGIDEAIYRTAEWYKKVVRGVGE